EGDDLPRIGWIGQDLLVAGHRGVEAHLAHGVASRAEAEPFQYGSIREYEQCGGLRLHPAVVGLALQRLSRIHRRTKSSARGAGTVPVDSSLCARICERP